jgi:hypothetical protein
MSDGGNYVSSFVLNGHNFRLENFMRLKPRLPGHPDAIGLSQKDLALFFGPIIKQYVESKE